MNFRDSEFAQGILLDAGFGKADSLEDADIVLFNTCSVRKHAEDRASANIWNLKKLKEKSPGLIIGVIGCMAQAKKEAVFEDIPLVDFTCGPDNETELPKIIEGVLKDRVNIASLDRIGLKRQELSPRYRDNSIKASVSVSHGCSNFCSYCIVPFVRGRERSRQPKDILREIADLADRGFKEILLLGQNVNSYDGYGGRRGGFVRLLAEIDKIKGDFWVRFITSHPKDASSGLFKAMRGLGKVCEHLHLPLQSGSDRVLRMMNRGYTGGDYLRLAESYKKFLPAGSLTTDIIVGFPSESEKDFKKTVDLMKRIEFDSAFIFQYSPRPYARASRLKDNVPPEEKSRRNGFLLEMQSRISKKLNESLIGLTQRILVEGRAPKEKSSNLLTGRTRTNKTALVEGRGRSLVGTFADVKIEGATCHTLRGEIV